MLSSLGTVYKQRNNPDYAALGASGAILAVLFAYIVYYPKQMLYLYFAIPIPAVVFAFGYLAYTLVGVEETRATTSTTMRTWTARSPGSSSSALTDFRGVEARVEQVSAARLS